MGSLRSQGALTSGLGASATRRQAEESLGGCGRSGGRMQVKAPKAGRFGDTQGGRDSAKAVISPGIRALANARLTLSMQERPDTR